MRELKGGWSFARLAGEFGMDRATVAKRLREACVLPTGLHNGFEVYRLADALPHLVRATPALGVVDPRDLPPIERRAYYQSENARLDFEFEVSRLVLAEDAESDFDSLIDQVTTVLESLAAELAGDCDLQPSQIARIEKLSARMRTTLSTKRHSQNVTEHPDADKS